MDLEIQNAVEVVFNPTSPQNLKGQALEYLDQLRSNTSAWQTCLSLFTRSPRILEVTRLYSLDILNHAIQTQLDAQSLTFVKDTLLQFVKETYSAESSSADPADQEPASLQNKLAQTMTFLFTVMYKSGWESFFDDFWQLAQLDLSAARSRNLALDLYLRVQSSVHDEIADVFITHPQDRQKLDTELKDEIRARDAAKISASWHAILSKWHSLSTDTVQLCLKNVAKWVSWIDINLVANESLLGALFEIATRDTTNAPNGDCRSTYAAIDVFAEIIAKKMPPAAKIDLIRSVNIEAVLANLVSSPNLEAARGTSAYDTDLAEMVAKMVNNVLEDLVRMLDGNQADPDTRQKAEQLLTLFTPHLLRFFSDEYDEVCSTVIPCLTDLLGLLRKLSKQLNGLPSPYSDMLPPILNAIIAKMRYDDTSEWGEEDAETDEAEFQELRKRLRVLQQIIAATDENLFLNVLGGVVATNLAALQAHPAQLNWRDLELAMMEMYLLGEAAMRNGGLYHKRLPSSNASEKLIQLMSSLVESSAAAYPHPSIHLQYMDICVRFNSFFDQHPQYIPRVLENFVSFMHSDHIKVRSRSWHFFLRFVRYLKAHLGNFSETVVRAIEDLLVIKAEIPTEDDDDNDMSSNQDSQPADAIFQSQLYLFEAIGCIASAPAVSAGTQIGITKSILGPLLQGMRDNSGQALSGDERAIYQMHHLMQAIGTLARGFSDWTPERAQGNVLGEVSTEFGAASDAILSALITLKGSITVRTGARFALSRLIGVLGFKALQQLPEWIDGLLTESSTKDEMVSFLRLIDQIIYGFKTQIRDILDTLLTPLLRRVFEGFATPVAGTDDELNLGELRREYLNFMLVLLNNNLDSVLVSATNQGMFDTVIAAIEHFAKDTSDHPDAKLAVAVLIRMCEVWGGPTIEKPTENAAAPAPTLPGFDGFMLTRISAATWAIMTNPSFDSKDPSANRVVGEIALLQQTILQKTGQTYLSWLRDTELRNLGAQDAAIEDYIQALTRTDAKGFKQYLLRFLQQSKGS